MKLKYSLREHNKSTDLTIGLYVRLKKIISSNPGHDINGQGYNNCIKSKR